MASEPRNRNMAIAGVVAVALLTFFLVRAGSGPGGKSAGPGASAVSSKEENDEAAGGSASRRGDRRSTDERILDSDDATVEYLRELFGGSIDNKRTRLKAIEKLLFYLMKKYPDDWQSRVQALLAQAFPGMADQLFAEYQSMQSYNDWLRAHREELNQMDPAERRAAIREAQDRFFGKEDADEIFQEARRHEELLNTVDSIAESHDTTVDQKLDTYLGAIDQSYGDAAPEFVERRQTELLGTFMALPSVQDDLHAMSPEQREQKMDEIRSKMGMDEEALQRWRDLDNLRDDQWSKGETYMQQRDQIVRDYQGDEQTKRLDELRQKTFGEDADNIRSEEDGGFFRFGHRRVYGKE